MCITCQKAWKLDLIFYYLLLDFLTIPTNKWRLQKGKENDKRLRLRPNQLLTWVPPIYITMKINKPQHIFWDVKNYFQKHEMILFQAMEDHELLHMIWNCSERLKFLWFNQIFPASKCMPPSFPSRVTKSVFLV